MACLSNEPLISKKSEIEAICDATEIYFKNPKEFKVARNFIMSFFDVMLNDDKFNREIIKKARTK